MGGVGWWATGLSHVSASARSRSMAVESVLHVIRCRHVASIRRLRASMTMFKQISMTNFKSWRETGPVRMAPLTGFFGANSSGKSSLLQMLLLLKQTVASKDLNLVLKTGAMGDDYVDLGTPFEIAHNESTELAMGIEWTFVPTNVSDTKLSVPVPNRRDSLEIGGMSFNSRILVNPQRNHVIELQYRYRDDVAIEFKRAGNNRYTIDITICGEKPVRAKGRPRVYMKPEKCYSFSDEALRYFQSTSYLNDFVLQFERQFEHLHYLGPLRPYAQRDYTLVGGNPQNVGFKGELAIHALLAAKNQKVYPDGRRQFSKLESRIAQWIVELGLAHRFETRPLFKGSNQYVVWLKRQSASPEVRLTDMGIGVSQVLPVLVLCYYVPEGSTIVLEQPELHLHPSVQAGLADVFVDVIKHRNVQILLESHSEHLLRRLQRRLAEEQIGNDDIALYFCENEEGESTLTRLETDMFGAIKNWPQDFFGDMTGDVVSAIDAGYERKKANVIAG